MEKTCFQEWGRQRDWQNGGLAVLPLLLLSLSSVAGLLPRWTSAALLLSEFYHNHTSTHKQPVLSLPGFATHAPTPLLPFALTSTKGSREEWVSGMLISIARGGAAVAYTQTKINGNVCARQGLTSSKWFTIHGRREINHMCQQALSFTCFLQAGCHNQQNISHSTDSLGKF